MVKVRNDIPLHEDGSVNIDQWLKQIDNSSEQVRSACLLARVAGEDRANAQGQSCFLQGLEIAEHMARLKLGDDAIAAALIYPSAEYADLEREDIEEQLGNRIALLVDDTKKLHNISTLQEKIQAEGQHLDTLRKMLLSMAQDVRVVIIKLAERLSLLRHCKHLPSIMQQQLAQETRDIYAPLASRLGTGIIKWQLEDLAFHILEPEQYRQIAKSLKERRTERDARVDHLKKVLQHFLEQSGIKGDVQGRAKHIFSIYRKMQRKKVGIEHIYDVIALRILVPTVEDCYTLLSYVHNTWIPIPEEFDDYIAHPKANGYRSLHTAAKDANGKTFEIQIRTYTMHDESEMGVAAHWLYKEGSAATGYETKIKWLRQLLEWQKEVTDNTQLPEELEKNVFEDRIYVFTPNGKIVDLPRHSTPLDFAYHIHTHIGHRCRGAKIKGKLVPLTTELQLGDVVEILTAKTDAPSRDWLIPQRAYLKSARARAKVLHWFKQQDAEHHAEQGRETFEREIKRLNVEKPNLEKLAHQLHFKDHQAMFTALGSGDLRFPQIIAAIQRELTSKTETSPETHDALLLEKKSVEKQFKGDIAIYGVGDLLTHIAHCCKPVPGDSIIGYITQGAGVSIHHKNCNNIIHLDDPYTNRLIEVQWIDQSHSKYPVDIEVLAQDRPGLISDIAQILSNEKISILNLSTTTNRKQHTATIIITIEIHDLSLLSKLLDRFNQIPNVTSAQRKRVHS